MDKYRLSPTKCWWRAMPGEKTRHSTLCSIAIKTRYIPTFISVRNAELAEDIFQETFTKAIVTIQQGRYNENGKFQAWLIRIAHNLIIDCYRQEKQENLISCDEEARNLLNSIQLSEER